MKTLMIVTGGLGTGGLERITCFIANNFCNRGWKVVILTLLQKKEELRSFQSLNRNVEVMYYSGKNDPIKHKLSSIRCWKKMIRNCVSLYNPDCVLAMTFKIASLICLSTPKIANRITIREISDPKSKSRNRFVNLLTEYFCRNVKNIIFQTNWEKSCFHKRIQRKGVVIPNPLSIQINKHGTFTEKRIFTLSRLFVYQKRQDVLIKAFEVFHETHPDYMLEIYGNGKDKKFLEQTIQSSRCRDFIKIFNPEPDIHNKILNYRCFVLTSDFEGMSNALLECYSLGIPCISSDWPGVEDVITDKCDGLLYKRQNVLELSTLLSEISENNDLCREITLKARLNSSRFDEKMIISRYCEAIESEI